MGCLLLIISISTSRAEDHTIGIYLNLSNGLVLEALSNQRGYSINGYTPSGEANFMMFSFALNKFQNKPDGQGYNLITCEYLRPNPVVKSANYFNSVVHYPKMQKFEAVDVSWLRSRKNQCRWCLHGILSYKEPISLHIFS